MITEAQPLHPEALQWHQRPDDSPPKCRVCGASDRIAAGEHRLTSRNEGYQRKYLRRYRTKGRPVVREEGNLWIVLRNRKPTGVSAPTRRKIIRAAQLHAHGHLMAEIADTLETSLAALEDLQFKYPAIWQAAYSEAVAAVVEPVRQAAGTDAILQEPDRFFRMAENAEKWLASKGEELFPVNGDVTLSTFCRDYYLPMCLANGAKTTRQYYEGTTKRWRLLTGDPPLKAITPELLAKFRDSLIASRGKTPDSKMSFTTVASRMRLIQTLLDKAGPSGRRNRDAVGILDKVPWARPPRAEQPLARIVPIEEVESVYKACDAMAIPTHDGISAATWWRALIAVTYNTGLRRRTLFELEWSHVNWEARWLSIPPKRLKSGRGEIIPLNDTALEHLRSVRTDGKYVFDWGHDFTWFCQMFHRLQYAAGLPREQHFGLHDLRRTLATNLWRHAPEAARLMLGHTAMDVTVRHYVNATSILGTAVLKIPQPEAFGGSKS